MVPSTISRNHLIQTLTTLNLNHNRIADLGAQHLAGALTLNKVGSRMMVALSFYATVPHPHFRR